MMKKTINPIRLRGAMADIMKRVLARECGVPASNVSRWLSGGDIPRKHYPTIAKVTGKSITYLCGSDDDN